MVEKIQSSLVNTIPLWKNQMVIAIGVEHSTQAARAQREVTDMTNALLKKNADALKVATIESAKEAERGIVDMETLKHTNQTLISTLDEVLKIQTEGKEFSTTESFFWFEIIAAAYLFANVDTCFCKAQCCVLCIVSIHVGIADLDVGLFNAYIINIKIYSYLIRGK